MLVVLVADILIRALPVFTERPGDFLTSPLSSRPARAGIVQGIIGSVLLMAFVAVLALPLGIGAAVYLEEYARDTWLVAADPHEHPQPRRRAGDRLRAARPGDLREHCSASASRWWPVA